MIRRLSLAIMLGLGLAAMAGPAAAYSLDYEFDLRACRENIHVTGTLQRSEVLDAYGVPTSIIDRGPVTGLSDTGDEYTGRLRLVWRGFYDGAERSVYKQRLSLTSPTARDVLIVERAVYDANGVQVEYSRTKTCT